MDPNRSQFRQLNGYKTNDSTNFNAARHLYSITDRMRWSGALLQVAARPRIQQRQETDVGDSQNTIEKDPAVLQRS